MVDLTPLKSWLEKGSLNSIGYAVSTISRIGFDEWFKAQLELYCNCKRTFNDGRRCTQTNDIRYSTELLTTIKMIENYGEDKQDEYLIQLIKLHQDNLEFEATNGLEYNPNSSKNKKNTTIKKKATKVSNNKDTKEKKETAAERKLKAHAAKINALIFKPKTVSNDNTL